MRKLIALGVIGVSALSLAACGGGETAVVKDDSPEPRQQVEVTTPAEFVANMDAICEETNEMAEDLEAEVDRLEAQSNTDGAWETVSEGQKMADAAIERMENLEVPASEADFFERFMESAIRQQALSTSLIERAEADGYADSTLEAEVGKLRAERKGLIDGHGGFEFCGENG